MSPYNATTHWTECSLNKKRLRSSNAVHVLNTIDCYLSPTRNTAAAKRFLGKALTGLKDWEKPSVINTDKAPTYSATLPS